MNLYVLLSVETSNVLTLLYYLFAFFFILTALFVVRCYFENFHNPLKLSDLEGEFSFEVLSIVGDKIKLRIIANDPPFFSEINVNYYSIMENWYEITEFPDRIREEGKKFKIVDKEFMEII